MVTKTQIEGQADSENCEDSLPEAVSERVTSLA